MVQFQVENDLRKVTEAKGSFRVLEYERDASVSSFNAQNEYFMQQMGVHRRQVLCTMNGKVGIVTQAGAMQWMGGNVNACRTWHRRDCCSCWRWAWAVL